MVDATPVDRTDDRLGSRAVIRVLPAPGEAFRGGRSVSLRSIESIRREMTRVYNAMKAGVIDAQAGTRLTYVLAEVRKSVELGVLEQRVRALEEREPSE